MTGDEVQGAQVGDQFAFEAAGAVEVEVEVLPGSCGRGSGRRGCGPHRRGNLEPRPPAAGRPPGTPHGTSPPVGRGRPAGPRSPAGSDPSVPGSGRRSPRSGPGRALPASSGDPLVGEAEDGVVVAQ